MVRYRGSQMVTHGPNQRRQPFMFGSWSVTEVLKWWLMGQIIDANPSCLAHGPLQGFSNGVSWAKPEMPTLYVWLMVCYRGSQMVTHGPNQRRQPFMFGSWSVTEVLKWILMGQIRDANPSCLAHGPLQRFSNGYSWAKSETPTLHVWLMVRYRGSQMVTHGPNQRRQPFMFGSWSITQVFKWWLMGQIRDANPSYLAHGPLQRFSNGVSWAKSETPTLHVWLMVHYRFSNGDSWAKSEMSTLHVWLMVRYSGSQMVTHGPNKRCQPFMFGSWSVTEVLKWWLMGQIRDANPSCLAHGPLKRFSNGYSWAKSEMPTLHVWLMVRYRGSQMVTHGPN